MNTPYYPEWRNTNVPVVPVQVAWAETPTPQRKIYHILEPSDTLQAGDEFWHSFLNKWLVSDLTPVVAIEELTYRREVRT